MTEMSNKDVRALISTGDYIPIKEYCKRYPFVVDRTIRRWIKQGEIEDGAEPKPCPFYLLIVLLSPILRYFLTITSYMYTFNRFNGDYLKLPSFNRV